jgi:MFS family permease
VPGNGSSLTRLRTAITVFFALDGFVFAGWVVRIPAIKEQTAASASALGLALLGVSAGAVVTMVLTGRLCRRYGNHRVTVACAVLLSLSVALPPLTHSALALGLVLLVFGAAYGGINVAFNSAAVDLVAAMRRPIMPSFHAAFSLGGMVGAGLGALVAGSLSPTRHLLLLTAVGLLVTAVAGPTLLRQKPPVPPERERPEASAAPSRPAGRTRGLVLVFGLIAGCTAYGEGALADWGALHLEEDLGASPGAAAIGYSCFALAMTVGRLTGTTLLERLGQSHGGGRDAARLARPRPVGGPARVRRHGHRPGEPLPRGRGTRGRARRPQRGRHGLHAGLRRHAAGAARHRVHGRLVLPPDRPHQCGGPRRRRRDHRFRDARRRGALILPRQAGHVRSQVIGAPAAGYPGPRPS